MRSDGHVTINQIKELGENVGESLRSNPPNSVYEKVDGSVYLTMKSDHYLSFGVIRLFK